MRLKKKKVTEDKSAIKMSRGEEGLGDDIRGKYEGEQCDSRESRGREFRRFGVINIGY